MFQFNNDRVFTVSNVITIIRIILIPVFILFLLQEQNIIAFLIFTIACISDGLDGFIARNFNQSSKLGALLDPIADRGLLLCGSVALYIIGRLPLWILILVLFRDLFFLLWGLFLLKKYKIEPKVIMLGKVATTFFYIGFALLVLGFPWAAHGFNIVDYSWLPGFNSQFYYLGIWPVYIGIILNILSSSYYIKAAIIKYKEAKNAKR